MRRLWSWAAGANSGTHRRQCLKASRSIARQPAKARSVSTVNHAASGLSASSRPDANRPQDEADRDSSLGQSWADLQYPDDEHRRRDLDRRFNEAQASLPCITGTAEDDLLETPWTTQNDIEGASAVLWSICQTQSNLKHHRRSAHHFDHHIDMVRLRYMLSSPPETPSLNADYDELENAQIIEEGERAGPYRLPKTDEQLAMAAQSVVGLVDELMFEAYKRRFRGDEMSMRQAMMVPDSPMGLIRTVRSDGFPRYGLVSSDEEAEKSANAALNNANDLTRRLFARWELALAQSKGLGGTEYPERLTLQILARICFNLQIQRFLPDIHTYNTLLLGFTRVGEQRLAAIVANNLFSKTKHRPTTQSVVDLLQHFQDTENILGFYHIIRRLIGKDSSGMMIGRRKVDDVRRYTSLADWALQPAVTLYRDFFVERWPPDASLFAAIIRGLIYFNQAQHAAQVLSLALFVDCPIPTQLFLRLLDLIISRLDYDAARIVMRGLCASVGDSTSLILSEGCPAELHGKLNQVIDLCIAQLSLRTKEATRRDSPTQMHSPAADLLQLLRTPLPSSPGLFRANGLTNLVDFAHIRLALWINETEHRLQALESITDQIRQHFVADHPKHACKHGLGILDRFSENTAWSRQAGERWLSASRYHILCSEYYNVLEKVEECERGLLAVIEPLMPAHFRNYILSTGFPLWKQVRVYLECYGCKPLGQMSFLTQLQIRGGVHLETRYNRRLLSRLDPEERATLRAKLETTNRDFPKDELLKATVKDDKDGEEDCLPSLMSW